MAFLAGGGGVGGHFPAHHSCENHSEMCGKDHVNYKVVHM